MPAQKSLETYWIHPMRCKNVVYNHWILKNWYIKNIILYFYSSLVTLVWKRRAVGGSSHTQRSRQESEQKARSDFIKNSRSYVVSKLPRDPHDHTSSSMKCLFFIGHGLHPRNVYASGSMSTHFCFFGSRFIDFIYDWMYLSTTSTGFIASQCNI